jgi:hypothetical protein
MDEVLDLRYITEAQTVEIESISEQIVLSLELSRQRARLMKTTFD